MENACQLRLFVESESGESRLPYRLGKALVLSQYDEKSQPRDAVYVVLDLIVTRTHLRDQYPTMLEVDYRKLLPHIIRNAVRCAVLENGNLCLLDTLVYTESMSQDEARTSSWAPAGCFRNSRTTRHFGLPN
jgi:hypothetical protein